MKADLRKLFHGALATRRPIAREFQFEGELVQCWFLDLSAADVRDLITRDDRIGLIASTVCDAEGNLIFTREQAAMLRIGPLTTLTHEALAAVGALREDKDEAKKPSASMEA